MRLRVQHEDGRLETVELLGERLQIVRGHLLDRIVADDLEHFFTKDGYYDGWGRALSASPADAGIIRDIVEARREIDDE